MSPFFRLPKGGHLGDAPLYIYIFSFLAKIQKYTALEEGEVYTMAKDGVHGALDTVDSVQRFGPIKNIVKKM